MIGRTAPIVVAILAFLMAAECVFAQSDRILQGGWWRLVTGDSFPEYDLVFEDNSELQSSYTGHMAPASLEALIVEGSFEISGNSIVLRTDQAGEGWLWSWNRVTCRFTVSSEMLTLTGCVGDGQKNGINMLPGTMASASFRHMRQ